MLKDSSELSCCEVDGFYIVPDFNRYCVNKNGDVYDRRKKEIIRPNMYNNYLYVGRLAIHRAVASVFLKLPYLEDGSVHVVNHKNGKTTDNTLSNLEWTSYSGNINHAYVNNLRSDNIPLLCKNLESGDITRFYSYWDCARNFGTNASKIYDYLNSKRENKIFYGKYILKKEKEEWPSVKIGSYQNGTPKELFVENIETKQSFIFSSITSASDLLKINKFTLMKKLRTMELKNEISVSFDCWKVMYLKNSLSLIDTGRVIRMQAKLPTKDISYFVRKPRKVQVTDLVAKTVKVYDSLQIFSDEIGKSKSTVQKHIYVNDGILYGKFAIKYI